MKLRDYQIESIAAVERFLAAESGNPCVVMPTGGGKTLVLAELCRRAVAAGRRAVVAVHVRELVRQNAASILTLAPDLGLSVGIDSASLGQRERGMPIIVAGIQSAWRQSAAYGCVDLVIVDEAHRIPPDGEGMYRTFLAAHPGARVVGLTATPYRTSTGMLCGPENLLTRVVHETSIRHLIERGFLCRLVSRGAAPSTVADVSGVRVRGGEFVAADLQNIVNQSALVQAAVGDVLERADGRRSMLVFCAGV